MKRAFLGGFLGSLLGPTLARVGRKVGGGLMLVAALAVAWLVQWFLAQPWWLRLLIVVALVAVVVAWVSKRDPESFQRRTRRRRLNRLTPADRAAVARGEMDLDGMFRRPPLEDQPHFLYRWFAPDGELLYIGISNDLARRTGQHIADKPWMEPGVTCEAVSYPNRAAVLAAEEEAIYAENPRYNIVHNRGPLW